MTEIETDYLVVGAGTSGMAFVDALIPSSDADIVMVDRRHAPGGHWLDAYPFVRLHQPSVYYGVNSRALGNDRIDESGPNAGFYERAMAAEIVEYFNRALVEDLIPSGQVRFFGMSDYRGRDGDGHHFVSRLTGEVTTVKVRGKLVDATYVESSIPSKHTPAFEVDPGVRLIPPNDLVHMADPGGRFTIIGAGKTAMDTCSWLLDEGASPERIRWIRPRDGWFFNRAYMQPLELVGSYMELQAQWVEAAAEAKDGREFAHRLEAAGSFVRLDTAFEPEVFRGATISLLEVEALRGIENIVRMGRVLRLGESSIELEQGSLDAAPGEIFVDCTAEGVRPTTPRPIFESGLITLQYVTIGIVPWGAAILGAVEASRDEDDEKNRLCPTLTFGRIADVLHMAYHGMSGLLARSTEPDLAAWNDASRLNPARGAAEHMDDPRVPAALTSLGTNLGPAMANLERLAQAPDVPVA